jgi:hypothetical protein
VAHVGKETCLRTCFLVKPKERDGLEDLGFDWRIILKCIIKKLNLMACTGLMWLGIGQMVGSAKHGNKLNIMSQQMHMYIIKH